MFAEKERKTATAAKLWERNSLGHFGVEARPLENGRNGRNGRADGPADSVKEGAGAGMAKLSQKLSWE